MRLPGFHIGAYRFPSALPKWITPSTTTGEEKIVPPRHHLADTDDHVVVEIRWAKTGIVVWRSIGFRPGCVQVAPFCFAPSVSNVQEVLCAARSMAISFPMCDPM